MKTKAEERKLTMNLKQISDSMKYRLIALKQITADLEIFHEELEECICRDFKKSKKSILSWQNRQKSPKIMLESGEKRP